MDSRRPNTSTQGVISRNSSDRQHVVQGHRNVRQHDLCDRFSCALGLWRDCCGRTSDRPGDASELDTYAASRLEFAPQLPAHPQQQQASSEHQSDNVNQLCRYEGEQNADESGCRNAQHQQTKAVPCCETSNRERDHDAIVARQYEVDDYYLHQRRDVRHLDHVSGSAFRRSSARVRKLTGSALGHESVALVTLSSFVCCRVCGIDPLHVIRDQVSGISFRTKVAKVVFRNAYYQRHHLTHGLTVLFELPPLIRIVRKQAKRTPAK